MSSLRSRSGGTRTRRTSSRKKRSSRNCPCSTSTERSLCVAATHRTSTVRVVSEPTGRTSPDCSTRSSFPCSDGRKIADLVEEDRPILRPPRTARAGCVAAPVNAPRAWPNSSLSSRCSGSAAQFTATNDRSARGPLVWIASATSSFPVPVSPEISTDEVASAICAMSARSCRIGRLLPEQLARREVRAQRPAQERVLARQRPLAAGPLDQRAERLQRERLGHVVVGAAAHGLHRALDGAEGGHDDHRRARVRLLDAGQQVEPVAPLHPQVGHHHVGRLLARTASSAVTPSWAIWVSNPAALRDRWRSSGPCRRRRRRRALAA